MGGFGACAFARRNLDRRTLLEAEVHDFVRSDDGTRVWTRKKRVKTAPAMYNMRDLGLAPLYAR
jgi:hypothetical protein